MSNKPSEPDKANRRHIVVVGAMGAGKTTVGTAVADRLGRPLFDSDAQIEAKTGQTVAEIADANGIDRVHALESEALNEALDSSPPAVIAAAASMIDDDTNVTRLTAEAFVIWLRIGAATELARMQADSGNTHRPRGEHFDKDGLAELIDERARRFAQVSGLTIDVDTTTLPDELEQIFAALENAG